MKVGNNKRSVAGIKIRNTDSTKNGGRATEIFKLEGSLLKEPESLGQRVQEHDLSWTPEILKESGQWEELLTKMMKPRDQSEANPPLETFFFFAAKEVRYLWFHLLTFNGLGGGLQFFAPILHSGEINRECSIFHSPPPRCVRVDQLDILQLVLRWRRSARDNKKSSEEGRRSTRCWLPLQRWRNPRLLWKLHRQIISHSSFILISFGDDYFCLEPFTFGSWKDTEVCTESCLLLQRRTCEEVNPRSSCQDVIVERVGDTSCFDLPCSGWIS